MGCQGEIYVIYGVQVDAKCEWEAKPEENPVVYSINGHTVCDDKDRAEEAGYGGEVEFYNGVPTVGYGANDMSKARLVMRVLGHSDWTGARQFCEGFGASVGKTGKALVGYVVGNESYTDSAVELPPGTEIVAQAPRLVDEIRTRLGLEINESDLRAHLLFDSING